MQDAIGQRRGNQIGAPHRKGSGNLVCGQPILDIRRVVGDRHSELPHTPKIGYGEVDCQQQHANQPEYLKGRNVFLLQDLEQPYLYHKTADYPPVK